MVLGDILEDLGRQVEAEINETGGQAIFLRLDVTSESDWERAVAETLARFGKLDILVNNAAILRSTPIEHTTVEEWDTVMAVNARGVFLGTKHAIPAMREAGGGSIINISSTAGLVGGQGGAYGTSKGGVRLFSKSAAVQLHTPRSYRHRDGRPRHQDARGPCRVRGPGVPMDRTGTVDDIAYGALFLASDESSFMTGAELVIDGGFNAQ